MFAEQIAGEQRNGNWTALLLVNGNTAGMAVCARKSFRRVNVYCDYYCRDNKGDYIIFY